MKNPVKEEIEFYLENKEFWRALWEPRLGDFYWFEKEVQVRWSRVLGILRGDVPLFRLDQLIEMLKERGWSLGGLHERPDSSWYVEIVRKLDEFGWAEGRSFEGITATIALAKALMEVCKEEK